MIVELTRLHDHELMMLPAPLTLFLFPVGGIEQHGSHLPIGTKVFQAEAWSMNLARKLQEKLPQWNFVIMPVLAMTVDSYTSRMAVTVRPHVLRDALVDQCESLKKKGFINFAALSSHLSPRQTCAIEDASKIVSRGKKSVLLSLTSTWIDAKTVWQSPMIALPSEHGGAADTGFMLSRFPDLVSPGASQLTPIPSPRASVGRFMDYFRGRLDGYWGRPADADSKYENERMDRELSLLIEKMLPVLEKGKGKAAFFSQYRWYPLNGSFFIAYLLAVVFFLSVFIWIMWGFRSVLE
jgi:creatinine amidohydrolase